MKYEKEAMDALRKARRNNPNVSQRRLARNIFILTDLSQAYKGFDPPVIGTTRELLGLLGCPSEVALQHLIRGIDRQFRIEARAAATVTNSATLNRKKARSSRNRKTAGVGSVHRI